MGDFNKITRRNVVKKFMKVVLAIVIITLPMAAFAQEDKGLTFGAKVGYTQAANEMVHDAMGRSWMVGADVIYFISESFGIGVDARYLPGGGAGNNIGGMMSSGGGYSGYGGSGGGRGGMGGSGMMGGSNSFSGMMDTHGDGTSLPISLNAYFRKEIQSGFGILIGAGATAVHANYSVDSRADFDWNDMRGSNWDQNSWMGEWAGQGYWNQNDWNNVDAVDIDFEENQWSYGFNVVFGITHQSGLFLEGQLIFAESDYEQTAMFMGNANGSMNVGTSNFVVGYRF
jgi:hypothetical protein